MKCPLCNTTEVNSCSLSMLIDWMREDWDNAAAELEIIDPFECLPEKE